MVKPMRRFHDVQQNTDEWFDLRKGKITCSNLGKIMANEGKAFGEPAKDYALEVAIERITGELKKNGYQNEHMQRGHEQEPLARMLYEDMFFCTVNNGGFFDCGNIGCSVDGIVGQPGRIEIKSVIDKVHYANVKRGGIDPSYKWQLFGNLKYSAGEWIDFLSFCVDFPEGKRLFRYRIFRNNCFKLFRRIDKRVRQFEELINQTCMEIERGKYL